MIDYQFDVNGSPLGTTSGNGDVIINTTNGNVNLTQARYVSADQFRALAAIVYGEAAASSVVLQLAAKTGKDSNREIARETFGIAYAIYAFTMIRKYGISGAIKDKGRYAAIGGNQYMEYINGQCKDKLREKLVNNAIIRLFATDWQYYKDIADIPAYNAIHWDGQDIYTNPNQIKFKVGFKLADASHGQLYAPLGKPVLTDRTATTNQFSFPFYYISCFTAGGTLFSKLHPDAVKGHNPY